MPDDVNIELLRLAGVLPMFGQQAGQDELPPATEDIRIPQRTGKPPINPAALPTRPFPWSVETPSDIPGTPSRLTPAQPGTATMGPAPVGSPFQQQIISPEGSAQFNPGTPGQLADWLASKRKEQQSQEAASTRRAEFEGKRQAQEEMQRRAAAAQQQAMVQQALQRVAVEYGPQAYLTALGSLTKAQQPTRAPGTPDAQIVQQMLQKGDIAGATNYMKQSREGLLGAQTQAAITKAGGIAAAQQPYKVALKAAPTAASQATLSPEAVDLQAQKILAGGTMDQLGIGSGGARVQIVNRLGEIAKGQGTGATDLVQRQAAVKSLQSGLTRMEGTAANVMSFAYTTDQNLDLVADYSQRVDRSGSPIINTWLNAGKRATGDPDITGFDVALRTAIDEYSKVVSSATGSAQVAQAERDKWEQLINAAQTPEQITEAIRVMRRDVQNRRNGFEAERQALRAHLAQVGSQSSSTSTGTPPTTTTPAASTPATPAAGGWRIVR